MISMSVCSRFVRAERAYAAACRSEAGASAEQVAAYHLAEDELKTAARDAVETGEPMDLRIKLGLIELRDAGVRG